MAQPLGPVPQIAWGRNPSEHDIAIRWFAQLRNQYNAGGYLEHNDLAGLQGGTTDEYYHLTAAQSAAVANLGSLGNNRVLYSNGSGVITTEAALGYDESTNILTVDNITVADNTILGSAAADALTINAGTWTLGSNYTATRAVGVAAAGTTNFGNWATTFSGDAGGTTTGRGQSFNITASGSSAISGFQSFLFLADHGGSNTASNVKGAQASISSISTGTISIANTFEAQVSAQGTASTITTANLFLGAAPSNSGGSTIGTLRGLTLGNLGATTVTTAIGILISNFTNSTTMRGIQSSLSSGTGKANLYIDGTADNLFAGNVRVGSVVAPTVALDVTGASQVSTYSAIGGSISSDVALWIQNTNLTTTSQGGILAMPVATTGSTTRVYGIEARTNSAAGSYNVTTVEAFRANTITLGAGATATNVLGFRCSNPSISGSSQTVGFLSEVASGTERYGFRATGTADNQFLGNTRIGSTVAPTVALDVTGAALISTTLGVTGNVTATADLAVNGGDITSSATTFNLLNATVTTLNIGGAATTLAMGAGAASSATLAFTTGIALNTAAITSNQTTVALLNATATTVNFAGGASAALNIGNASGLATIAGPLRSVGNFDVNTNKFTVTASNGNTLVAGTLNVTGITTLNNKIYPATDAAATQSAAGLYAGTGAPNNANGADGDIYFRSDGGALSTVYQRRAGTWTGVL